MSLNSSDWKKILAGLGLATAAVLTGGAAAPAAAGAAGATGGAAGAGAGIGAGLGVGATGAAGAAGTGTLLGAAGKFVAPMLASQGLGLAASGAAPKYDVNAPGQAPANQAMDLNALVQKPQQGPSRLNKLQLGFRRY